MLIGKNSSSAHELLLQFLSVDQGWCACERWSATGALEIPVVTRRARPKAFRRTASSKHSAVGCRCAPRPGAVAVGSGATTGWPSASEPAVTRNNSLFAARFRHPTHVRTGPVGAEGSGHAGRMCSRATDDKTSALGQRISNWGAGPYRGGVPHGSQDFADDFDQTDVDRSTWLTSYLPAWSSRAASAATYTVENSCLSLSIPPAQGLWCAGHHEPPLRVSGVQSGGW